MIYSPPILHIGFPKTGTTSLQRHLLPKLCNEEGYIFNPPEFIKIFKQNLNYSEKDKALLRGVIKNQKVLISAAKLIDPNPRNCKIAADKILDLFGQNVKIIITIRDPIEYLCSVYVQKIHSGNIYKPEDFFISSNEYEKVDFTLKKKVFRFDYESLDYQLVKNIYKTRFSEVYFVPTTRINTLYPFNELFSLNENKSQYFRELLKHVPRENRAYSMFAVKLTFFREKVLNKFGIKSLGSDDKLPHDQFVKSNLMNYRFNDLSFKHKVISFCPRLLKKIIKPWRFWMQSVLDRLFPYKKYRLPEKVLQKLDNNLNKKNVKFLEDLEYLIDTKLNPKAKTPPSKN